jgi:hypothetical protein
VTDAVEPGRQKVEQEAADELVGGECHDALAGRAIAAIIVLAERDAGLVESKQPPVRDGDPVGLAREVGEHRFGAGEGRLGVDCPVVAGPREVAQRSASGARSPKKASLPASWSAISLVSNRRRNNLLRTRTGRRNAGREEIQRCS